MFGLDEEQAMIDEEDEEETQESGDQTGQGYSHDSDASCDGEEEAEAANDEEADDSESDDGEEDEEIAATSELDDGEPKDVTEEEHEDDENDGSSSSGSTEESDEVDEEIVATLRRIDSRDRARAELERAQEQARSEMGASHSWYRQAIAAEPSAVGGWWRSEWTYTGWQESRRQPADNSQHQWRDT